MADRAPATAGNSQPIRVVAVASGKGGVGKSNLALNLALALADRGRKVTLFDADLGLANVDVLLGLHPIRNLSHVLQGQCELRDILLTGPYDIAIVPAASGVKMLTGLTPTQHNALIQAFDALAESTDTLIIDTSAGISASVCMFCSAAQEVVVVVCDEPTSITDAYALMKVLHVQHGVSRFRILVNRVRRDGDARALYQRLLKVTDRFLTISVGYFGAIPEDDYVIQAVQRQQPFYSAYPNCAAAIAIKELAKSAAHWPRPQRANGRLEFFLERMLAEQTALQRLAP